jgi:hypothetical protein
MRWLNYHFEGIRDCSIADIVTQELVVACQESPSKCERGVALDQLEAYVRDATGSCDLDASDEISHSFGVLSPNSPTDPTVGAQSIVPAQSIAHGQIGDSISQKTKFLKNLFYKR